MKFVTSLLAAVIAFSPALPTAAMAQQRGTEAQRAHNLHATSDMRSRLAEAVERVRVTEQHGKISPARSAILRRQLAGAQRDMARQSRRQGFVSAAELATYDRLVASVDAELGAGAVSRGYGHDALPSAEVTAFQRADARLRYRDARIDHDARGCAVYRGTAPNGAMRIEPLRDPVGKPICMRR